MGEKVVRIRKRKRIEEQPREIVPIVEDEREIENEERAIFEDNTVQLQDLPITVEETTTPPVIT